MLYVPFVAILKACGLVAAPGGPIINLSSAKKSLLHDPTQRLALVRSDLVAMMQGVGVDDELLVRIPDHDVSIEAQLQWRLFATVAKPAQRDLHRASWPYQAMKIHGGALRSKQPAA